MGTKQSIPAANGRTRAYSNSDMPSSAPSASSNSSGRALAMRYQAYSAATHGTPRVASAPGSVANAIGGSGFRPQSVHPDGLNIARRRESDSTGASEESDAPRAPRFLIGSLPTHLSPHVFEGFRCPVCSKFVPADETDFHLVMCFTKLGVTYNEDVLVKDAGECAICLEDLEQGDTIARLPCLCIYHKGCIDEWFEVNRSCPEHPSD
uniref:RING-type E3 ubiquitin transferase n=1 Tax=Paramormyrops kingsleyae TaxID=1676925 RepID=A0A3B3QFT4_9TELE|nr:E3 ubiquitin-protein ligase znrf2-like [Paramormyrops kingsleyae]